MLQLGKASRGFMFAHEDIIADRPYSTTVTCSSIKGELYKMGKEDFFSKLTKNERVWRDILADAL